MSTYKENVVVQDILDAIANKKDHGRTVYVNYDKKKGDPINDALRRFKKRVDKSEVMEELKKREYYKKPSLIKKEKKKNY